MLATKSITNWSSRLMGVAIAVCVLSTGQSDGQQPPSTRYQPTKKNVYESAKHAPAPIGRTGVRQISHQTTEPAVPAILAGAKSAPAPSLVTTKQIASNAFQPPSDPNQQSIGGVKHTLPPKSPADFANQFGIATGGSTTTQTVPAPATKGATIPVGVAPQTGSAVTPTSPQTAVAPIPPAARVPSVQQTAIAAAAHRQPAPPRVASLRSNLGQFDDLRTGQPIATAQTVTKQPAAVSPAIKHVATAPTIQPTIGGGPIQDAQVRPVAAIEPAGRGPKIKIAAPAIEVVTIGPETIGVNKPSQYQVVVRNNSLIPANRILVGVDLPAWVDIGNVSMTTGGKEVSDSDEQARLVWSVDQVPSNSTQTMTITAIPKKAEIFDVGVEWTLVPLVGKTTIRVTEPKLEMSMSGPKEVQYGETALYHVAVRNPGTGAAENVTVMLPEALGGERASLGLISPGKEKNFQVELLARTAGDLNLLATATGDGNLKASSERALIVRRANLEVSMVGPPLKYSGGIGKYTVTVSNTGDATAADLVAAIALPEGVKYLKGIDAVKLIDGGMRWPVGSLAPNQSRTYSMFCELNSSGELKLDAGVRGKMGSELAASNFCNTTVETIADLVLTVADLKGPLPTGEKVPYTIKIRNRGTRAAKGVNLVMKFSEGIEPHAAKGREHQIVPGKVQFAPIKNIDPGQEVAFEVTAEAYQSGTHRFRAELVCEESDTREIAEGTTRYFGDPVQPPNFLNQSAASTANANTNQFE